MRVSRGTHEKKDNAVYLTLKQTISGVNHLVLLGESLVQDTLGLPQGRDLLGAGVLAGPVGGVTLLAGVLEVLAVLLRALKLLRGVLEAVLLAGLLVREAALARLLHLRVLGARGVVHLRLREEGVVGVLVLGLVRARLRLHLREVRRAVLEHADHRRAAL